MEAAEGRDLKEEPNVEPRPHLTLYTERPLPPLALLWLAMGRLCPHTGSKMNFPLMGNALVDAPLQNGHPFTFLALIKLIIIIITITSHPDAKSTTYAKAIFISALFIITSVIHQYFIILGFVIPIFG